MSNANKDQHPTKLVNPDSNEKTSQKAAAPLASLSSHVDPFPHYVMAAACATGSGFAYSKLNNPRAAAIAGGCAAAYFLAGRLLVTGNPKGGYDLGTVTSVGLLAAVGPRAYNMGESYSVALASLAGISSLANVVKSYQQRTGKPHELREERQ
jgi:uncharacterized membrane protein (UPF0136 family)